MLTAVAPMQTEMEFVQIKIVTITTPTYLLPLVLPVMITIPILSTMSSKQMAVLVKEKRQPVQMLIMTGFVRQMIAMIIMPMCLLVLVRLVMIIIPIPKTM